MYTSLWKAGVPIIDQIILQSAQYFHTRPLQDLSMKRQSIEYACKFKLLLYIIIMYYLKI